MPIIKAAKKALRSSEKKRKQNLRRKRKMKDLFKQVEKLVSQNNKQEAQQLLPQAYKAIDKAQKRGVIKKNTASRRKSRLAKIVKTSS